MLTDLRPLRHDDPEEHFHLEFDLEELLQSDSDVQVEDIMGLETFRQQSVGIDIGSSTSHLIFSELILRREKNSSKFTVSDRRVLYYSPILLTPYVSGTQIDSDRLRGFIERTYKDAGVEPDEVDTGAVVITGEALKKENARPILEMFREQAGKFICASAGPNHEALLAAYGSGAAGLSRDQGWRILNVDMGGGTTKMSLIEGGSVKETAAINIGARLIAFDADDKLTRIEEVARIVLGEEGQQLKLGETVSMETKERLTERMAECLFEVILGKPYSDLTEELMITQPMASYTGVDCVDKIVFSGGVSEYVYGREEKGYGDLGPLLGKSVRWRLAASGHEDMLEGSASGIRATVVGAGEYTVQASGNTSFISSADALPVFALKVVKPEPDETEVFADATRRALQKFDLTEYGAGLAMALPIGNDMSYPYLRKVAQDVAGVLKAGDGNIGTFFLVLEKDVAKTLGALLKEEFRVEQDIVAIDGIDVGDLDYIDIGRPMGSSEVLPVTVKSLIFPTKIKI